MLACSSNVLRFRMNYTVALQSILSICSIRSICSICHLQEFKKTRGARVDRYATETNRLVVRLDKLLRCCTLDAAGLGISRATLKILIMYIFFPKHTQNLSK